MATLTDPRIASAPARRQGYARRTRRLRPPLTATGAPARQVTMQLLTRLLRSLTTGSENTKFLTPPDQQRRAQDLADSRYTAQNLVLAPPGLGAAHGFINIVLEVLEPAF